MRLTLDISASVLRQLKEIAAREGCSVHAIVLRVVESEMRKNGSRNGSKNERARKRSRRVKLPLIRSKAPGTLYLDNAKIAELLFP